ncbi:hypothetical protein MMC08_003791 [Hypocenomyce scalaris]|nr:hypothetical protein [Hypocenomyce scalaris]
MCCSKNRATRSSRCTARRTAKAGKVPSDLPPSYESHNTPTVFHSSDEKDYIHITADPAGAEPISLSPNYNELSAPEVNSLQQPLQRAFQVPTQTRLLSSGFAYPSQLAPYDISEEKWDEFSSSLVSEARMTANRWMSALGRGGAPLVVGAFALHWMGFFPMSFYIHRLRLSGEKANMVAARISGGLEQKIELWNEHFFRPRGLIIRFELPGEVAEMKNTDLVVPGCCGRQRKVVYAAGSEEGWALSQRDTKTITNLVQRARLVISAPKSS